MIWRAIVLGAWLLWLLVYWRGGLTTLRDIRAAANPLDRLLLVILSTCAILLLALLLAVFVGWLPADNQTAILIPAAILTLIGIGGTFYCRAYLGQFWTAEAVIQAQHQVIESGPYRIVRHPIYACALLLFAGSAFTFLNPWTLLCSSVIITAYAFKAELEDRLLRASLPGYTDYVRRVKYRLLPGVW